MIREDQRLEVPGEGSGLRRGRPYPFIALPDIALRLIDLQTGAEVAQTQSDVHGVYDFPEVPPARYKLCWEAEGWLPGCWQKLVSTADGPAYVPPIGIKPARSEGRRAVAG